MGSAYRGVWSGRLQVGMQRLEHVMTAPRVAALLEAVDARLTSNTFLLAHRVDHTDVAPAPAAMLHVPAFAESLCSADRQRAWDTYPRP